MAAPDLTFARAKLEELMTDTCTVTVAPDSVRGDDLDPDTLVLTPEGRVIVYDGPCLVSARNPSGQTSQTLNSDGGLETWAGRYTLKTPFAEDDFPPGAVVELTASQDAWLLGKTFTVIASMGGTYKASRRTEIELREAAL